MTKRYAFVQVFITGVTYEPPMFRHVILSAASEEEAYAEGGRWHDEHPPDGDLKGLKPINDYVFEVPR